MANGGGSTAAERAGRGETEAERGGAFGGFAGEDRATGRAEVSRSREQESAFGKALKRAGARVQAKFETIGERITSPTGLGALGGFLLGGVPGAKLGAVAGSLFEEEEEKGVGAPAIQAQAAPQQLTRAAPGVTPQAASAQQQFAGLGQLGGDGRQVTAVQPPAVPPQQQFVSGVQPQMGALGQAPQQRFLTQGGALPTVNLGAFPGALGRV